MLIAFEGGDGCGKSTQAALLVRRLEREGTPTHLASFPRYEDPVLGDLIRRFLRGDLGDAGSVHPRLVALLFAADRAAEAPNLRRALCEGRVVVCDRYFYSNLAYQGAKLEDAAAVEEFARWLRTLEFVHNAIPAPACSLYLDVHQGERAERLRARGRAGDVNGAVANDIHERDSALQERVAEMFHAAAQRYEDLVPVECADGGRLLSPEEVHERVWAVLASRGLAPAATPAPPVSST